MTRSMLTASLTTSLTASLLVAAAAALAPAGAQQRQGEMHGNVARSTQSHDRSWGGGAEYQLTWGDEHQPVQLGTSLGGDYSKDEHGDGSQVGASFDVTLQHSAGRVTPYVGGGISQNWLRGSGAPSAPQVGFEYMVGTQIKLAPQGPVALRLEVRPGYVRTQEHEVGVRVGLSSSM